MPKAKEVAITIPTHGIKVSPLGVVNFNGAGLEDIEALIGNVLEYKDRLQWVVGDCFIAREKKDRPLESDVELDERWGLSRSTVREYAYVCRKYPMSIRIDGLSFAHHHAAASLAEEQRQELLNDAYVEGWSVSRLREEITAIKAGPSHVLLPDPDEHKQPEAYDDVEFSEFGEDEEPENEPDPDPAEPDTMFLRARATCSKLQRELTDLGLLKRVRPQIQAIYEVLQ